MCTGLKTHSHQAESAVGQPCQRPAQPQYRSIWSVPSPISLSTLRPRRTRVGARSSTRAYAPLAAWQPWLRANVWSA